MDAKTRGLVRDRIRKYIARNPVRPEIERITIQVRLRLPKKFTDSLEKEFGGMALPASQPIEYILEQSQIQKYCGIGWEPKHPGALVEGNVFAWLEKQSQNGNIQKKGEEIEKKWNEHNSPCPAFLLKLPDCNTDSPDDICLI